MDEENNRGISRNVLKLIAIATITVGHFFLYTFTTLHLIRDFPALLRGSLCYVCFVGPPIFMFFISEGFRYTSSRQRYGKRLLLFALITQVIFAITTKSGLGFDLTTFFFRWNVFFALLFGFLDLCILTSRQRTAWKLFEVLATLILTYFTATEWGVFGQLIIIAYYYLRDHRLLKFLVASLLNYLTFVFGDCLYGGTYEVTFWARNMPYILTFGMIGIALVSFFYQGRNGKKNKFMQYFFYVFYPLHLLIIDVVILIAKAS